MLRMLLLRLPLSLAWPPGFLKSTTYSSGELGQEALGFGKVPSA